MQQGQFQIVAQINQTGRIPKQRVIAVLAHDFDLDAKELEKKLANGEVLLCSISSKSEARRLCEKAIAAGAICRVVDSNDVASTGTLLGWKASEKAPVEEKFVPSSNQSEKKAPTKGGPVADDFLNLDNLDSGLLVSLDYQENPQQAPPPSPIKSVPSQPGILQQGQPKSPVKDSVPPLERKFTGPLPNASGAWESGGTSEDEPLELDYEAAGLGAAGSKEKRSSGSSPDLRISESGTFSALRGSETGPFIPIERRSDAFERKAGSTSQPRVSAESSPNIPTVTPVSQRALKTTGSARRQKVKIPPQIMFKSWFHQSPRLRILCGFMVVIGISSLFPLIYANYVMSSSIEPLRVELSTAKAHGHLLSEMPNYRPPQKIEEEISSIQTKNRIFTFCVWFFSSSVLGLLWFRFV